MTGSSAPGILTVVQLEDITAAVKAARRRTPSGPITRRGDIGRAWWGLSLHGSQAAARRPLTVAAYLSEEAIAAGPCPRWSRHEQPSGPHRTDPRASPGIDLELKGLKRQRGSAPTRQVHPLNPDERRAEGRHPSRRLLEESHGRCASAAPLYRKPSVTDGDSPWWSSGKTALNPSKGADVGPQLTPARPKRPRV